jgi:hypothetical protein
MTTLNQGSGRGRKRKPITEGDVIGEIDDVMATLINMKNDGRSWRMIANEIETEHIKLTPSLIRSTALGLCRSPKIEMALGLREETATVPLSQVRKYPRRSKPRFKRTRFTADVEPELIVDIDSICADAGVTRSKLLTWWTKNHEDFLMFFHGPGDYAELPY